MNEIPVKVTCYSGHKADESPQFFIWNDITCKITEIIDGWYQKKMPDYKTSNYFKVKTSESETFLLKHDLESDSWFLIKQMK